MPIDPFKPMGPLPGGSGPLNQSAGPQKRVCEACNGQVSGPHIYGSGRFCSELCATLRTPEAHWKWLLDHPEELEEWQAKEKERQKSKKDILRDLPL